MNAVALERIRLAVIVSESGASCSVEQWLSEFLVGSIPATSTYVAPVNRGLHAFPGRARG